MIPANKAQAKQIKALIKDYKDLDIPTEIRETNKDCYVFACITNRFDHNGERTSNMQIAVKTIENVERMRDAEGNITNKTFNCHKVHILHDPTLQEGSELI